MFDHILDLLAMFVASLSVHFYMKWGNGHVFNTPSQYDVSHIVASSLKCRKENIRVAVDTPPPFPHLISEKKPISRRFAL